MTSTPVETAANVLVISVHDSFRAHVKKWLPPPCVNVIETDVVNVERRVKELPPQLLIIDKQLDRVSDLLSRLAVMIPGGPDLVVSGERATPTKPSVFSIVS